METISSDKFTPDGKQFCVLTFDTFCLNDDDDYDEPEGLKMIYEVKRSSENCVLCDLQRIHYSIKRVPYQNKPANIENGEIHEFDDETDVFYVENIEMLFNIKGK